jgi:hypothetical protein
MQRSIDRADSTDAMTTETSGWVSRLLLIEGLGEAIRFGIHENGTPEAEENLTEKPRAGRRLLNGGRLQT